jgi:single-stranded-DNA-specific exonuclease
LADHTTEGMDRSIDHGSSPLLWKSAEVCEDDISRLSIALSVPPVVAKWLCLRGLTEAADALEYLHGSEPFTAPDDFLDMAEAVRILTDAVEQRQTIAIVGDYDADGVTSTAILHLVMKALGGQVMCLIPHREEDGYGLSTSLVDRAREAGAKVLCTVDNGIRAMDAVSYAKHAGMVVVVTDHHEPGEQLPDANALIHYERHRYPRIAKRLSGAGVAWKLGVALLEASATRSVGRDIGAAERDELHHLAMGYAAVGAIADRMPLYGENRRLLREGLNALAGVSHAGWQAFLARAGVQKQPVSVGDVEWKLAPRLNAAGRMDSAEVAYRLLMATNDASAATYAEQLEELNKARRSASLRASAEAIAATALGDVDRPSGVVVAGPWKLGVVGIVAARVAEVFQCPTVVFSDFGEPILRGSGRTYGHRPLYSLIEACSAHLHHYGGHEGAVGCGVERDRLETFRSAFQEQARRVADSVLPSAIDERAPVADDFLALSDVTLDLVQWKQRFEPFGEGNPDFLFYLGPLQIKEIQWMGADSKHARLHVAEGNVEHGLVWFQVPEAVKQWKAGQQIAVFARLEKNEWRGNLRPQLRVERGFLLDNPLLREQFAQMYLWFRRKGVITKSEMVGKRAETARLPLLFQIFCELGFAEDEGTAYHIVHTPKPRDLRHSTTYQRHLWQCMQAALKGPSA